MVTVLYAALANTILTMLWIIVRRIRRQNVSLSLLFLLVPFLGYVIYYVPIWMLKLQKVAGYDRDSLVRRIEVEKPTNELDVESALSVVPVQDALVQGSNSEKRQLLLTQLKRGLSLSYPTIKAAENDSDSESVHYVSAAKMQLYNKYFNLLRSSREKIEDAPANERHRANYLNDLSMFIDSELLQSIEKKLYMEQFCATFPGVDKAENSPLYNKYMLYICQLGMEDSIAAELSEGDHGSWDYDTYKALLDHYYSRDDKEKFLRVMNMLRASGVVLDEEGFEMVRYWQKEVREYAVN